MPVTFAMVEDDAPFAAALQRYFALVKEVQCVAHYRSADAALEKITSDPPEVLLVDINLPGMSGIEFVSRIKLRFPQVLCLMLTMYEESTLIFESRCLRLLAQTRLPQGGRRGHRRDAHGRISHVSGDRPAGGELFSSESRGSNAISGAGRSRD